MNIIKNRNKIFLISLALIAIGLGFMVYHIIQGHGAFNYSVDFTSGTEITFDVGRVFDNDEVATVIVSATGQQSPQIQKVIGTNQVSIKVQSLDEATRAKVVTAISETFKVESASIEINDMSATISNEMKSSAILAIVSACIVMLLYVSIRFRDFRMGGSAILALLHDTMLVILSYAVIRIPLSYSFIAVVLTILGYSINATIVIFDRVRENKKILKRPTAEELINISVGQTFKRCIYTSLTVLIVCICMYVLGVTDIRNFIMPIMVGVIFGTYSSIYLSGCLWYIFTNGFKKSLNKNA